MPNIRTKNFRKISTLFATSCLGLTILAPMSFAAPSGGVVVGGNAQISQKDTQTTIDQSTQKAAINWNSFNVAANESVEFKVPSGGSTLNRITNGKESLISGTVKSNGSVYFVNNNGLVFDAKSSVTVNDFTATTADVKPDVFMQGGIQLQFNPTNRASQIQLQGTINVSERGVVAVFAPHIDNSGTINAKSGLVDLSGVAVQTTDKPAKPGTRETTIDVTVRNSGTIRAEGGQIILTTGKSDQSATDVGAANYTGLIQNSGSLIASNAKGKGGSVQIITFAGPIIDTGLIDVSGNRGGGSVVLYANDKVDVTNAIKAVGLSAKPCAECVSNGGTVVIVSKGAANITGKITVTSENGDNDGTVQINPTDLTPPKN